MEEKNVQNPITSGVYINIHRIVISHLKVHVQNTSIMLCPAGFIAVWMCVSVLESTISYFMLIGLVSMDRGTRSQAIPHTFHPNADLDFLLWSCF